MVLAAMGTLVIAGCGGGSTALPRPTGSVSLPSPTFSRTTAPSPTQSGRPRHRELVRGDG